jgi:hypothetical protein
MKNDGVPLESSLKAAAGEVRLVSEPAKISRVIVSKSSEYAARLNGNIRITRQARQYAVAELIRRAGIPFDFFQSWKLSWNHGRMVFDIPNGTLKQLSFPCVPETTLNNLAQGRISTARALWLGGSAPSGLPPDLAIPFIQKDVGAKAPLFRVIDQDHVECAFDLPLVVLLTLSRWEETLEIPRDIHGRVSASSSVAARDGFLDRPIVDEYALALEQAMQVLFPSWPRKERRLRVKLSVDADHVGIPFRWKNALRHTMHYHAPLDSGRDVLGWMGATETPDLRALRETVLLATKCALKPSVYWKASPPGMRDSGYDPRDYRVRRVIDWLTDIGADSGVQPGYTTFRSPERLRREVSILREVLGDRPLGGRQHYLRWCPDTWIHWESCGLSYDSSVGYADRIGFRAGTCIPYRPWLLSLNRPAELLEIPLIMMDRTLLGYMHLSPEEVLPVLADCANRCRAVGGVLSVVWHNNTLLDPPYRSAYMKLLGLCSHADDYDWQTDNWGAGPNCRNDR